MGIWKLKNKTPFNADYCFYRDDVDGGEVWIIGVKATFDIKGDNPGELSISDEQVNVFLSPEYRGDENRSSLLYDSDLVLRKDYVDIIVNGHAHAVGQPVTNSMVCVEVGKWSKTLNVFGERYWIRELGVIYKTDPQKFDKIPIIYENAYGGLSEFEQPDKNGNPTPLFDIRNPVGRGFRKKRKELIRCRLPNFEYPDCKTTTGKSKRNRVACFGAIPAHWSPRINFAGTYDDDFLTSKSLGRPGDFDSRYYNSAPVDQQLKNIEDGIGVRLTNLTPNGKLIFYLPIVQVFFKTWLKDRFIKHRGTLHSVIIEPDYPRVSMLWQTSIKCQYQEHFIEDSLITHDLRF